MSEQDLWARKLAELESQEWMLAELAEYGGMAELELAAVRQARAALARDPTPAPEQPAVVVATQEQLTAEQVNNLVGPLRVIALIVPRRMSDEEIGDALEVIDRLCGSGGHPWEVRIKVWTTVFGVLVNAGREFMSAMLGKKKSGN